MADQSAKLAWRGGVVPVSVQFDDPYFSTRDGLAETRHVFLDGNNLPARMCDGFHIAELGFGTGLNALAAWQAWRDTGRRGTLYFTSFEAFPMATADMLTALGAFPQLAPLAKQMVAGLQAGTEVRLDGFVLRVIAGDARQSVARWDGAADAWFLDGFSPAKNPELWQADLMAQVAGHTKPGGTFATYSAAGRVRRALVDAGFDVSRPPGFGTKRHMSIGRLARV